VAKGSRPRPSLGFTFRETMGGFLVPGTDSAPGAAVRSDRADPFRFRVRITVADLAEFLADPAHQARLSGTVESPRFGGTLPVIDGTFNLFVRDEVDRKQMRYRLPFRGGDGQDYLLAGVKDIRDGHGFDLWADTTTLFVTVRRRGADEPILANGTLRIRPLDLIPQVCSMRAVNARTPIDHAIALVRFGGFFFGQLWREYGPVRALKARRRHASERGDG
jgi:cholesterol oxidase